MQTIRKIQLGKNGVTDNFVKTLESQFKSTKNVKISVLQSANRKKIKEYADKIIKKLEGNYSYRIIGFVIVMKKLRGDKIEKRKD